jgi:hypothetical protein
LGFLQDAENSCSVTRPFPTFLGLVTAGCVRLTYVSRSFLPWRAFYVWHKDVARRRAPHRVEALADVRIEGVAADSHARDTVFRCRAAAAAVTIARCLKMRFFPVCR